VSTETSFLFPGLEDLKRMYRADATAALRRRFGLAAIVPFDARQQANRTPARVSVARGLQLAGQFTSYRTAELSAGY